MPCSYETGDDIKNECACLSRLVLQSQDVYDLMVLQWQGHRLITAVSSYGVELAMGYASIGQIVPEPSFFPQIEQWTEMEQNPIIFKR